MVALKNTSKPKGLVQVGVFKISPQRARHIGGPTGFERVAVPPCELTRAGISPLFPARLLCTCQLWGWQGALPALFSSLLCLSDITILLTETVLDCWGTSKPPWQAYKHVMIYSPAFHLCHFVCWEMSLQESSISVYYLWAKPCLPQQSTRKLHGLLMAL